MKILCDEGVPRALARALRDLGLGVSDFPSEWRGLSNGRLIAAATEAGFDVLLSNDKNLAFQLNLATLRLAIVALPNNRRPSLLPRSADIAQTLRSVRPGQCVAMASNGSRSLRRLAEDGLVVVEAMAPIAPFDRRPGETA